MLKSRTFLPIILVLILAQLATVLATTIIARETRLAARLRFQSDASAMRDVVASVMEAYGQALRAGAGLVNASETVTRDKWRVFAAALQLEKNYPGIQGLGFVPVIQAKDLASHEEARRNEGAPDYKVHPDTPRNTYTPIMYLEPEDWRNKRALGFDMFTETTRQRAMERARDTGDLSLTDKVTLLQETDSNVQAGVLMYQAVYAGGVVPATVEERRAKHIGYVYAPLRMTDFFSQSLDKQLPGITSRVQLEAFSGSAEESAKLLYVSGSPDAGGEDPSPATRAPMFHETLPISVAGMDWVLAASSRRGFEKAIDWTKPWITFFSGTLFSLLVSGITASLTYARDQSRAAEERLSAEVAERRRAEEEARLANGELIHRVKNTLAVVTAIASQTARSSKSLDEFSRSFRERLVALSRVHDLLRPDPAFTPELGQFMRDLLSPYADRTADTLALAGPPVHIPRNEAVLLSLLLNELATNATKYGAWSTPSGRVDVKWVVNGAEEIEIDWREAGGPEVAAPTRSGFGSNVMQFAVERGLRGKITTTFEPAGVHYNVKIPKPKVAPEAQAEANKA